MGAGQHPTCHSATRGLAKIQPGMNRLGFDAKGVIDAAARLHAGGYQLILTTHFANADDSSHR